MLPLTRRSVLAGAAGSAALFATPIAVRAQALAPPPESRPPRRPASEEARQ